MSDLTVIEYIMDNEIDVMYLVEQRGLNEVLEAIRNGSFNKKLQEELESN